MSALKYVSIVLLALALAGTCGYTLATSGTFAETVPDFVFWSLCILVVFILVSRQLLREAIVERLIKRKHPASMAVSSWITSGDGFTNAVNRDYIWGEESRKLFRLPDVRRYVIIFRAVDLLGPFLAVVIVGLLAYELGRSLG